MAKQSNPVDVLQDEIMANKREIEHLRKQLIRSLLVLDLLTAAGFITKEKIDQAHSLAETL